MKYIPTLLVDDDKILLDGLIHALDWNANGFEIIATASNGIQALKYYHQFHPQLIITDIVMPVMNGISLLKEIRTADPSAYILMLSSYDDFDYAKQSLNYQANGYILKDEITGESLCQKLAQIRNALNANSKQTNIISQKLIHDLFNSKVLPYREPESTTNSILFETAFFYQFLELPTPLFPSSSKTELMEAVLSSINICSFEKVELYLTAPVSSRHILLLFKPISEKSLSQIQHTMYHTAANLKKYLKKALEIETVIFYSEYPQSILECKKIYERIQLDQRYFCHEPAPAHCIQNINTVKPAEKVLSTDFDIRALHTLLETNDLQGTEKILKSFFNEYSDPYVFYGLEASVFQLFSLLNDHYYQRKKHPLLPPVLSTYSEFVDWYMKICRQITFTHHANNSDLSMPVKLTIENINKLFPDPNLNISSLASEVYLSPGYLSTIFKAETGKSINEFVTDIRISKAKFFLNNPELKIYHIASLCGYSSSQYFSQIFQKYTGITPKQYRRRKQNE